MSAPGQVAEFVESKWATANTLAAKHRTKLHALATVAVLVFARPNDAQNGLTVALLLLGLALRVWALGCISKNRTLCTWGPYKYTRNPLYLANLLIAGGLCVFANHWLATLVCAALLIPVYAATVRQEEEKLAGIFDEEYAHYCAVTPRFIPNLRPASRGPAGEFRISHALRQGVLGQTLVFMALLGAVEAKQEYMQARGIVAPPTYGVLPLSVVAPKREAPVGVLPAGSSTSGALALVALPPLGRRADPITVASRQPILRTGLRATGTPRPAPSVSPPRC